MVVPPQDIQQSPASLGILSGHAHQAWAPRGFGSRRRSQRRGKIPKRKPGFVFIHRAENPEMCSCSTGRAPGQDWALLTTCPFQSLSSPPSAAQTQNSSEEHKQSSPALLGASKTLLLPWNSPISCPTEPAPAASCLPSLPSLLAPSSWSSTILSGKSQKERDRAGQGKSQQVSRTHLPWSTACSGQLPWNWGVVEVGKAL